MKQRAIRMLVNYLAFQAGWFACVLSAAAGRPAIGLLVVAMVIAWHLLVAERPAREIRLLLGCALTGLVFDSLLLMFGLVDYPAGKWAPWLAPYWIVTMWVLFGSTLNLSMRWLRGRYLLAAVLGGIAGPLTYLAGVKLGAMVFLQPLAATIALAVGWALAMPWLAWMASRLDGFEPEQVPAFVMRSWRRA